MAGWDTLRNLVAEEIIQRGQEGCNVAGFQEKLNESTNDAQLMTIYNELVTLQIEEAFPFDEPSELEEIRAKRPNGPRMLAITEDEQILKDKFYGAWLGRCVGCALGKPLEMGPFMGGTKENPGWKNVKHWFEGANAWPISDYAPGHSYFAEELDITLAHPNSQRENIHFMESDDDLRYTVIGLKMLEEKGLDWDSWDIGQLWHHALTYKQVCTAETQAFLNFTQVTSHMNNQKPEDWQQKKEWVRTYLNPYREWIGAQIRADGLAYGAAGNPELAAEFAWRDASFSHIKNGIYGEMLIAAMIAAAFAEDDLGKIIEIGLSEIPENSRLTHDVRKAIEIAKSTDDQVELVSKIWEAFKHYHPVHTNNNAALVIASLLQAKGDFEKAITTAVLGGWDTDCNGATVGSIMGAILGANALPEKWTKRLNDTLYAEVNGFHPIKISECAERSFNVFQQIKETLHQTEEEV